MEDKEATTATTTTTTVSKQQEGSKELPRKYFFVEHVDLGLFDWALCEYENMMMYLKGTNSRIVFTNTHNF